MHEKAPKKYWKDLEPDFDIAAKVRPSCASLSLSLSLGPQKLTPIHRTRLQRRVFDSGYYESLGAPNMELIADDTVTSVQGDKVMTKAGRTVRADVIVLATGFKVRDCTSSSSSLPSAPTSVSADELSLAPPPPRSSPSSSSLTVLFPLKIVNDKGVSLQDRLNATGVKTYQSTLVSDFPNFFWIMGPNSATGHSSVLFTSEAQLNLVFHLVRPLLNQLRKNHKGRPAPYVEVTTEAEDRLYGRLRAEMKKKIWEKDGGVVRPLLSQSVASCPPADPSPSPSSSPRPQSWYVDQKTGLCTTLYPYSQVHFWRSCTYPRYGDFKWTKASPPATWRSYLGYY